MTSPDEFDRHFIETNLLPTIQKFNGNPAYKDYNTFVTHPGTGYTPGMDLNDYWQSWLNSKTWGEAAKKHSLPKYEVPDTCNPFYEEYDKLKRVQWLPNTATWEATYNYAAKEGFSKEDVQYINTRRGEKITFTKYMGEIFDDQVLKEWRAKDWKEAFRRSPEDAEFIQVGGVRDKIDLSRKSLNMLPKVLN